MGLERVAYLLQGVDNLYEIDEVFPVIEKAAELIAGRSATARTPATTSGSGWSPTTCAPA
jgi:alanyl-tRNA synthetase